MQRVLVDGWTPAQAAAVFGAGERQVVFWVAAYRRHGMASLRDDTGRNATPWRWPGRFRALMTRLLLGLRRTARQAAPAPCITLRRQGEDGRS